MRRGETTPGGETSAGAVPAGPSGPDPCSLVTAEDVGGWLQQPVNAGERANTGDATLVLCDYNYVDPSITGFASVGYRAGIGEADLLDESGVGPDAGTVEGIGSSAFGSCGESDGVPYCTIAAWDPAAELAVFVKVSMSGADPANLRNAAEQIAILAIG